MDTERSRSGSQSLSAAPDCTVDVQLHWFESIAESDCNTQMLGQTSGSLSVVCLSLRFPFFGLALTGFIKDAVAAHLTYAAKSVFRSSAGIGPDFFHLSIK